MLTIGVSAENLRSPAAVLENRSSARRQTPRTIPTLF